MKHCVSQTILLSGLLVVSGFCWPTTASAATKTWTGGGANDDWSTVSNWSPSGAPQNGDTLEFPSFAARKTSSNNLLGLQVHSILFSGSSYTLSGNLIRLESDITDNHVGTGNRVRCYVQFVNGGGSFTTAGAGALDVNGDVILSAGGELALFCGGGGLTVSGSIFGQGSVIKHGLSSLTLAGNYANDFSGPLTIREGTNYLAKAAGVTAVPCDLILGHRDDFTFGHVVLQSPNQIADTATNFINHGDMELNGWDEALGPIRFYDGDIRTGTATLALLAQVTQLSWVYVRACSIGGTVYLPADTIFQLNDDDGFFLNAHVHGPGGLVQNGSGILHLGRTNTFSGAVTVNGGLIIIENGSGLGSAPNATFNNDGSLGLSDFGGGLHILNKTLTFNSDHGSLNGYWGDWAITGPLNLNFTGMFRCHGVDSGVGPMLRLYGPIQGTGGIVYGGGNVELAANNTYTGPTRIACKLLLANTGTSRPFSEPLEIGGTYTYMNRNVARYFLGTNAVAELRWLTSQFSGHNTVTLHTNALVNLNGFDRQFAFLTFNGGRIVTGAGKLYVNSVTVNPTNVLATIEGNVLLVAAPTIFDVADGSASLDFAITGVVSDNLGISGIAKSGAGEMLLSVGNTYRGTSQIIGGVLHIHNASSLGATGAGTTVSDGATLHVESVATLTEPLNIRGFGRGGTQGALHLLTGTSVENLVLGGPAAVRVDSSFSILAGAVSGTGPLTKLGAGTLQLGGGNGTANTFTGDTIVDEGTMVLFKPPFIQAVPGHLIVGRLAGGTTAIARHFNHDQVWASITVNRGGLLDLLGFDEYSGDVTLNGGGDIQTGAGTLILGAGANVYVAPGNNGASVITGRLRISNGCAFSVGVQTFPIFNSPPPLDVQAVISDPAGDNLFYKIGSGEMRLSGANTFRANFIVSDGRATVAHSSGLGQSSNQKFPFATYVNGSGQLALDGGIALNDVLELDSTNALVLQSLNGSNYLGGPIALFQPMTLSIPAPNGILQIANTVNGPGGVTKLGPGTLQFWGTAANTYAGFTTVAEGIIEARRDNQISIPGDAIIGDDSTSIPTARIRIRREQQFPRTASVTIRRSGLLHLAPVTATPPPTPTLRSVLGSGSIQNVGSTSSLTISNDASFEFAGSITGDGALIKYGAGTMRMTSDGTMSGPTTIYGGAMRVDGIFDNSPIDVRGGAGVSGDGVLGNVTAFDGGPNLNQGSLVMADSKFPDHSGGDLEVGNLLMSFNFGGPISFGNLNLDFFGPSPTGGNDRIMARGAVDIGNARLAPRFAYPPREGDVLTVIEKQSAGPIIGTFSGLSQDALFVSNGIPVRISYTGGNGNDITLTVTNLALSYAGGSVFSGNGNGTIEADECLLMRVNVFNRRANAVVITNTLLRSLTPGVEVTIASSPYPLVGANRGTFNSVPFQFRTASPYVCGTPVSFELEVGVTGEGIFAVPFQIPGSTNCAVAGGGKCEACFTVTRIFTNNTPTTVRPLDFLGSPSLCLPAKRCPQTNFADQAAVPYLAYGFGNTTANELCVTAQLRSTCPDPLGVVAYLSPHDPLDPCANYLGDSGALGTNAFSFKVPAGSNFVINVVARTTNTVCGAHTIEVFGLPCPPPRLRIAKEAAPEKVLVQWSTAYPGWTLQNADRFPGSFSNSVEVPAIVGGRYTQTNSSAGTNQFYRLIK